MMNISKALLLTCCASAALFVSCSEDSDNEKYASKAPVFSGMQIYDAQGNKVSKVKAGEKFVVVKRVLCLTAPRMLGVSHLR